MKTIKFLFLFSFLSMFSSTIFTCSGGAITILLDERGCWIRPAPRRPKCPPSTAAIRIDCKECNNSGYTNNMCSYCHGKKQLTRKVNYGRFICLESFVCPDCCGKGKRVHQICNGHGFIWYCDPSN